MDIEEVKAPLLTEKEAATFLGCAMQTLRSSRVSGTLAGVTAPKFIKMGRWVRYKLDTLEKWQEQFIEVQSTSETA